MLKVGKHTYFADGQPIIKENLSKVIIGFDSLYKLWGSLLCG